MHVGRQTGGRRGSPGRPPLFPGDPPSARPSAGARGKPHRNCCCQGARQTGGRSDVGEKASSPRQGLPAGETSVPEPPRLQPPAAILSHLGAGAAREGHVHSQPRTQARRGTEPHQRWALCKGPLCVRPLRLTTTTWGRVSPGAEEAVAQRGSVAVPSSHGQQEGAFKSLSAQSSPS